MTAVADQDHDATGVGVARHMHHHPQGRTRQVGGGGVAGDASVPAVGKRHHHPLAQTGALDQQLATKRHLARVGGAVDRWHAHGAREREGVWVLGGCPRLGSWLW